jgi:hypothetical protein
MSLRATNERPSNVASGLSILLGAWLVVSPWIIGYVSREMMWHDVVVGAALVAIAAVRAGSHRRAAVPGWLGLLLGLWLIVAPFVLFSIETSQKWNSVIIGAVVAILAVIVAGAPPHRPI